MPLYQILWYGFGYFTSSMRRYFNHAFLVGLTQSPAISCLKGNLFDVKGNILHYLLVSEAKDRIRPEKQGLGRGRHVKLVGVSPSIQVNKEAFTIGRQKVRRTHLEGLHVSTIKRMTLPCTRTARAWKWVTVSECLWRQLVSCRHRVQVSWGFQF